MRINENLNDDLVWKELGIDLKELSYSKSCTYGAMVYYQLPGHDKQEGYKLVEKGGYKATDFIYNNEEEDKIALPGNAVVDRFIREKYQIFMEINMDKDEKLYCDTIHDCRAHKVIKIPDATKYEVYENAWEFGIKFVINYIKENYGD